MAKRKTGPQGLTSLRREIDRHRAAYTDLVAQRDEIAEELEAVEQEIAQYDEVLGAWGMGSTSAPKKKRGRPAGRGKTAAKKKTGRRGAVKGQARGNNTMTLHDAMIKALKGRTLGVSELAEAVKKIGYKTKSDNFRTIVNQTLIKSPRQFKKVARGQYTVK